MEVATYLSVVVAVAEELLVSMDTLVEAPVNDLHRSSISALTPRSAFLSIKTYASPSPAPGEYCTVAFFGCATIVQPLMTGQISVVKS